MPKPPNNGTAPLVTSDVLSLAFACRPNGTLQGVFGLPEYEQTRSLNGQGDFPTEQIALIVSERIAIDAN
jgi:hypothetical protein